MLKTAHIPFSDRPREIDQSNTQEEVAKRMRKRLHGSHATWNRIYKDAMEDHDFISGRQWDPDLKDKRTEQQQPCMVFNHMRQFVENVTGEYQRNSQNIAVRPVGANTTTMKNMTGDKDYEIAVVVQGLVEDIERSSKATRAYVRALTTSVRGGIAYLRVDVRYSDRSVFDQEIRITNISDWQRVYYDTRVLKEPLFEGAEWAAVTHSISRMEFINRYGEDKLPAPNQGIFDLVSGQGGDSPINVTEEGSSKEEEMVEIVEYFEMETHKKTMVQLADGKIEEKEKIMDVLDELEAGGNGVVREREMMRLVPVWRLMTASGILEGPVELQCSRIPIVPVQGILMETSQGVELESLPHHAKDPQREYNLWRSVASEQVAASPSPRLVVHTEQIQANRELWEDYRGPRSVQPYGGDPKLPPPHVIGGVAAGVAEMQVAASSQEEIKSAMGIYSTSLGARSNERSGKAIAARHQQSATGTSRFVENLTEAIEEVGSIIMEYIPHVYTEERVVRVVAPDEVEDHVKINEQVLDQDTGNMVVVRDLGQYKYDMRVKAEANMDSRREKALETMSMILQTSPETGQYLLDLVVQMLDVPLADKAAARIRRTLPPKLLSVKERQQMQREAEEAGPSQEEQQAAEMAQLQMSEQQSKTTRAEMEMMQMTNLEEITRKQVEQVLKEKEQEKNKKA